MKEDFDVNIYDVINEPEVFKFLTNYLGTKLRLFPVCYVSISYLNQYLFVQGKETFSVPSFAEKAQSEQKVFKNFLIF